MASKTHEKRLTRQQEIDALRNTDYDEYCRQRRRYLLRQAAAYKKGEKCKQR